MKKIFFVTGFVLLLLTSAHSQQVYDLDGANKDIGISYDPLEVLANMLSGSDSSVFVASFPFDYQQSLGGVGFGLGISPILVMEGFSGSTPYIVEFKFGPHLYLSGKGIDGLYLKARGIYWYYSPDFERDPLYGFEGMVGFNFLPADPMGNGAMLFGPEVGFQTLNSTTKLKVGFKFGSAF